MQPGDECWVLRRDGAWDRCVVRYLDHGADGKGAPLMGVERVVTAVVGVDHWRPADLEAMAALRTAVEVARQARHGRISGLRQFRIAMDALEEAERTEAEARARLEALR